jgi:ATP-dependent helicase/nuclease subunit B
MNFPPYCRFAPDVSFVDALACWLLDQEHDPLAFARMLVLLPTRRACRSLREAFLRETNGKPMLLPRILPIGEVDGETDILNFLDGENETTLPIMPERRRIAMLTRLIMQGESTTPARAYQLAMELTRLLDETTRSGIGFEKLAELVPLELAAHWQKTVEFLSLITRQWPRILEAEGKEDATANARKNMLRLAEKWRTSPPDFPVIAAGSTGSIPATAALLTSIASLPNGHVILPGLDKGMSDEAWEMLEPTHPQYGLRRFLQTAGISRASVYDLSPPHSNTTLRSIFAPAALTARWSKTELPLAHDMSHISLMEASTQLDEARMIAYKLREALDTPGKTAALVTPDRILARMVAAECARYDIIIDDSAGQRLDDSAPAIFMELLLELVASGTAPTALLALLRHPFTANAIDTATCREMSRILEVNYLRDVRFAEGMDALVQEIKTRAQHPELLSFIARLRDIVRPLEMLFATREPQELSTIIRIHCGVAEQLATTHETQGADIIWAKESGVALAELLAGWAEEGAPLGALAPADYPALFSALLSGSVVRQPFGTHPRLHILSPIEARLIHYDRVILGEMNDGIWPCAMPPDPWMSAAMRESFGLPPHAVQIGQNAHDVWMLAHANEVIFSRARKIFGAPQESSRWWVRLVTLVKGKDEILLSKIDISDAMQATINAQDAPAQMPAHKRPQPTPPRDARPRKFSPSAIELWQQEPYAFYAKYILRLKSLQGLDQEPDAADFGKRIHEVLEKFSADHPKKLPEHAYQLLITKGEQAFAPLSNQPSVIALWWPRFEAIARNWLAREQLLRAEQYETHSEVSAKWEFEMAGEKIVFSARADRVDVTHDGSRLIDYKTGTPPAKKKIEEGEAKQLPLTALALMRSGRIEKTPTALIYWALKTREQSKDFVELNDATALLAQTEAELFTMIKESFNETAAYAAENIRLLPKARDEYDHLIRRSEWGGD